MSDVKEHIDNIQEEIFDKRTNNENFFLRYTIEGFVESVSLIIYMFSMNIEISLWNSENEERKWVEEDNNYEDFKPFLLRKINETQISLNELKLILNETTTPN